MLTVFGKGPGTPTPRCESVALEIALFFRPISFDSFCLWLVHECLGRSSAITGHTANKKMTSQCEASNRELSNPSQPQPRLPSYSISLQQC